MYPTFSQIFYGWRPSFKSLVLNWANLNFHRFVTFAHFLTSLSLLLKFSVSKLCHFVKSWLYVQQYFYLTLHIYFSFCFLIIYFLVYCYYIVLLISLILHRIWSSCVIQSDKMAFLQSCFIKTLSNTTWDTLHHCFMF